VAFDSNLTHFQTLLVSHCYPVGEHCQLGEEGWTATAESVVSSVWNRL
jgi:hypothetical protein